MVYSRPGSSTEVIDGSINSARMLLFSLPTNNNEDRIGVYSGPNK